MDPRLQELADVIVELAAREIEMPSEIGWQDDSEEELADGDTDKRHASLSALPAQIQTTA